MVILIFQLRRRVSAFLTLVVFGLALIGQEAHADNYPSKLTFRNVIADIDIALGEVNAIVQDHEGFMWLGGRNGLLRYDGYEFEPVYVRVDPADPSKDSPVSHAVSLSVDSRETLWVATHTGLYKYNRNINALTPVKSVNTLAEENRPGNYSSVIEAPTGDILAAGYNGLFALDRKTLAVTHFPDVISGMAAAMGNTVNDMLVDRSGTYIWLGTNAGLTRLHWQDKRFDYFTPYPQQADSVPDNTVITLAQDRNGHIWLGTANGLYRFNPETRIFKRYQHNPNDRFTITDNASRDLMVDSRGWLWFGANSGGLSLYDYDNDRFTRIENHEGQYGNLASGSVVKIYEDRVGDLWVGTYPSGANFHDRSSTAITVYKRDSKRELGLLADDVGAVIEDAEGNLWIGAGGISRFNRNTGTFTHYTPNETGAGHYSSTATLTLFIDSDGDLWAGTWGSGLHRYNRDSDSFEALPFDTTFARAGKKVSDKLNDTVVWSIYQDSNNEFWLGTHHGGLCRFNKNTGTYTFYREEDDNPTAISNQVVWTSLEDSRGRFWVGTSNGLNLMDRDAGTFHRYFASDEPGSLANNSVLTIFEDSKHRMWFGTDQGLHLYQEQSDSFTVFNTRNGFSDSGIRSIVEDPNGNLWLSTNSGVVMFNPDTMYVKSYQTYNGRPIGGFDTGSGILTSRGEVVFGGENGLRIFNLDELIQNDQYRSPVVLTDFTIFTKSVPVNGPEHILNKVINQTEKITLDYKKAMFSFKFAALNYRDPGKNQYAYMLEGFDDAWREVGNQRVATYTNLGAGTYKFRVRANNGDGQWYARQMPLTIKIEPPPWLTWWAYLGYAWMIAGVLYFRSQHRRLQISAETYKTKSVTDPLTELYNRAGINQVTEGLFSDSESRTGTAVMLMDIDHFKRINDRWGHDVGDSILAGVAKKIAHNVRRGDYVGRWGGEEFILICPTTSAESADVIAEKLRSAVAKHVFETGSAKQLVTLSIGVAVSQPTDTFESVLKRADKMLYQAKTLGRNCVCVADQSAQRNSA